MIAHTRKQALVYQIDKIRFQYPKEVMNALYLFLVDIGAKNEIPDDRKSYLIRLHEAISINNPVYPEDVNFDEIYPKFFNDVITGKAKRYGNNLSALVQCFNSWYQLNSHRYIEHKIIATPSNDSESGRRIEQWSDESINSAYNTLAMIYGDYRELEIFKSTKGQIARLKREYETRFKNT